MHIVFLSNGLHTRAYIVTERKKEKTNIIIHYYICYHFVTAVFTTIRYMSICFTFLHSTIIINLYMYVYN